MKKEEIEKFLKENKIKKNSYLHLEGAGIKSIKLRSGREIFPDWHHMRVCFSDKFLKIQYGKSESFGGRLIGMMQFSHDFRTLTLKIEDGKIPYIAGGEFREPKFGDRIRSSIDKTILSEAVVTEIRRNADYSVMLSLSHPMSTEGRISFYDPIISKDPYSVSGDVVDGIYKRLILNEESLSKKEIVHEIIKYQEITEICV